MKTTLIKIISAFRPLCELMDDVTDYRTAHRLVMLKKALLPHVEFFNETERKLIEKYAVKDDDGEPLFEDGRYTVEGKYRDEYIARRRELDAVEADIPDVRLPKAPENIKASQLEALMEIIRFPEGDEEDAENN